MEAIERFEIVFDNQHASYLEGQEVKGQVEVDLNEDTVIETLTAEFYGKAVIMWCKEKGTTNNHRNMTASQEEERYLNQRVTLYSRVCSDANSSVQQNFIVPKGKVSYPFSIQLPYDLPQSLVATHGRLNYYVRATLERPLYPHQTTRKMFTVKSNVDLSLMPQALRPIHCNVSMQQTLMCFVTGSLSASWKLDKMGYIPGEKIKIVGEVHNNTRWSVKHSKALLKQHILYRDRKGKYLHEKKAIATVKKRDISPGTTCFWREELSIPEDTPPSGMKGCNLMQVRYTLTLKVVPNLLSKQLVAETDVIIGTTRQGSNSSRHSTVSTVSEDMSTSVFDLLRKLDPSPPVSPVSEAPPVDDNGNSLDMSYFV